MAKGAYIGAPADVPVFDEGLVTITADNVSEYFDVATTGNNAFTGSGGVFSSAPGTNSSSAKTSEDTWTAKVHISDLALDYTVGGKALLNSSYVIITVAGVEVVNATSEGTAGSWHGEIKAGETIVFAARNNNTASTISNIVAQTRVQVGTETKDVAYKIQRCYVGVATEFPLIGYRTVGLNENSISSYFEVEDTGSYGFSWGGEGYSSSPATSSSAKCDSETTWTAKCDILDLSFNYMVGDKPSLYSAYIKITVAGTEVVSDTTALSTGSWNGVIKAGDTIVFSARNDDTVGTISTIRATTQVIQGYETREVARLVKKAYIGVGGLAMLCYNGAKFEAQKSEATDKIRIVNQGVSTTAVTVYYSTDFTFDDQTGEFLLTNPATVDVSYSKYTDAVRTLVDKYFMLEGNSGTTMYQATSTSAASKTTASVSGKTMYRVYVSDCYQYTAVNLEAEDQ